MISSGADVFWKGMGISCSKGVIQLPGMDTERYGKTNYTDFQFYYYFRKLNMDVFLQNYKGFYLTNDNNNSLDIRSDMKMFNTGINLTYVFSDNYSFRSSFTQTERQRTSSGSFISMLSMNYFSIDSSRSLIPSESEYLYDENAGYKKGDYHSAVLSGGYSYTMIIHNNWYMTLSVLVGGGWMYQTYTVLQGKQKSNTLCSQFNNRLAFGYNGESYFTGIITVIDMHSTEPLMSINDNNNIIITRMSVYAKIFIGMRF